MNIDWSVLQKLIAAHQVFVITSHVRPDADAIGSEIGLAQVLQALGKTTRIINTSPTPPNLKFLDPTGEVKQLGATATNADILTADVQVIVDTSAWQQLSDVGKVYREGKVPRVVIDHHVSADDLQALEFKDTSREATGALIYELATVLGVTPNATAAQALFAAMATDTGWFRFSATSSETYRIAGELIRCGANPATIFRELYEQGTLARVQLAGRILSRVKVEDGGQLAYTSVSQEDFAETGALPSDTEDLVNECLKIAGTQAAFIAIEQANRQVKVSFRSRNNINVAEIAEKFNGGGHRQAAGATLPGPLTQAIAQALTVMKAQLSAVESE